MPKLHYVFVFNGVKVRKFESMEFAYKHAFESGTQALNFLGFLHSVSS